MMTNDRLRELRETTTLRQDEMAVLLSSGVASIYRWERSGASLPMGLVSQIYNALDVLDRRGKGIEEVGDRFRMHGPLKAVASILNDYSQELT